MITVLVWLVTHVAVGVRTCALHACACSQLQYRPPLLVLAVIQTLYVHISHIHMATCKYLLTRTRLEITFYVCRDDESSIHHYHPTAERPDGIRSGRYPAPFEDLLPLPPPCHAAWPFPGLLVMFLGRWPASPTLQYHCLCLSCSNLEAL